MKHVFLIAIFLLCGWTGFTQNLTIKGTAPGAEGKYITLSQPEDLITNTEKVLAKVRIDSTGNFTISADVNTVIPGKLSIDFHSAEFFIGPGKNYELRILPYKYDDIKELNPFINSTNIQIELLNLPLDDVNYVLAAFDEIYNNFLVENFNALYRDHNKILLDTLNARVLASIGEPSDPYVKSYIEYKLANLIQLSHSMNQALIGFTYFTTKPVLFDNLGYMEFFGSYFEKYLTATSMLLKKNDYHSLLSRPDAYSALMKALGTDSILKSEDLRELVLLKGLWEMYRITPDDQKPILSVFNAVQQNSKEPHNRLIASNIIKSLTNLQPGTPAPLFTLRNKDNENTVRLDSLRGKIVVLNFWTSYCTGCTNEMDLLKPLADKFKGKVEFVSISSEYFWQKMVVFLRMKPDWDWTFLHIGDQIDVLKAYDVRSLPLFVIIDKDGKIYKYPAEMPSSGLENSLEQLVQLSK